MKHSSIGSDVNTSKYARIFFACVLVMYPRSVLYVLEVYISPNCETLLFIVNNLDLKQIVLNDVALLIPV